MIEDINKTKLINFQNPRIGTKTIQSNRVKFTNLVHISLVWLLRKQIKLKKKKNLINLKLTVVLEASNSLSVSHSMMSFLTLWTLFLYFLWILRSEVCGFFGFKWRAYKPRESNHRWCKRKHLWVKVWPCRYTGKPRRPWEHRVQPHDLWLGPSALAPPLWNWRRRSWRKASRREETAVDGDLFGFD